MSSPVRILIADDHPLVRTGVRLALGRAPENVPVGEAGNGDQALSLVTSLKPDMLILDVDMPGLKTENLIAAALEVHPALKVLILSSHTGDEVLPRIRGLKIFGYVLKDESSDHLLQAVRAISEGATWFSQTIANKMMGQARERNTVKFTRREREILGLIAAGKDNRWIAENLVLAEQTVRNYATIIYEKIGVQSRVEAVIWVKEHPLN